MQLMAEGQTGDCTSLLVRGWSLPPITSIPFAWGAGTIELHHAPIMKPVEAWAGGHATLKGGSIEFYWTAPTGGKNWFAFSR